MQLANLPTMNYDLEWQYRYNERLSLLCLDADPTPDEQRIARNEADRAIGRLKAEPVRCWQCGNDWPAKEMDETSCCPTCVALLNLKTTLVKRGKLKPERQCSLPYAD